MHDAVDDVFVSFVLFQSSSQLTHPAFHPDASSCRPQQTPAPIVMLVVRRILSETRGMICLLCPPGLVTVRRLFYNSASSKKDCVGRGLIIAADVMGEKDTI